MAEKRYIIVPYVFDKSMWSLTLLRMAEDFTYDEMGQLVGVTTSCVKQWVNMKFTGDFQYPSMTNVIKVCNLMDITPALMFKVSDE